MDGSISRLRADSPVLCNVGRVRVSSRQKVHAGPFASCASILDARGEWGQLRVPTPRDVDGMDVAEDFREHVGGDVPCDQVVGRERNALSGAIPIADD